MPEEDQVQDSVELESSEEVKTSEDNQDSTEEEKSNKGQSDKGEVFKLPDGREVDAKTLSKQWKEEFYPEFTRRSQKLKELERENVERAKSAKQATQKSITDDEMLKNVPPDVRSVIGKLTEPLIQRALRERDTVAQARERERLFDENIAGLEKKYSGKDGSPKFDKYEVLKALRAEGNKNYDPESRFRELHEKEFNDILVKEALKQKGKGHKTEKTGQGGPRKPERKKMTTFKEAANSFRDRLSS